MNALVPAGDHNALMPANLDDAIRLAKAMASAKLVPEHLQSDVGSCLLVIEQSLRWKMSPFAVAQCTSVIHGRLMWEGKLVAAVVESSGALAGRLRYTHTGSGDDRSVTASARLRGEDQDREVTVVLKDVRTKDKQGNANRQWTGGQVDPKTTPFIRFRIDPNRPTHSFDGFTNDSQTNSGPFILVLSMQSFENVKDPRMCL